MSPRDHLLLLSFATRDEAAEEFVLGWLFLVGSRGSWSSEEGGVTTVTSYFDSAEERDAARAAFEGLDNSKVEVKAEVADRERVDWLDRYQQSLEAMNIGERFVVAPDASLFPADSERLTIVVPQEQAFGTGSHETTSLCIELLETLDLRGAQGLDVGAGSGILALATLRLGAARVLAFDNDLDAYAALRENRIRNGIPERAMPLFIGRIESLRRGTFDVITMNILAEVVIELLADTLDHLSLNGQVLVSGILVSRRDDVVFAASAYRLRLLEERQKGEWWAGVFEPSRGAGRGSRSQV